MFFSAQRLFPRNHRDSQDVFFGDSKPNHFWFLKISQTSKFELKKQTSSTPKNCQLGSKAWWFGNVSPSPRGIFRFHVSQQFFGTIFSVWQDPGSLLHLGTPSSKSTRPTSQQVGLEKKAGKMRKMHETGVPKGTYAVHIQDINFYSLNPIHACELCFHPRWTSMSAP